MSEEEAREKLRGKPFSQADVVIALSKLIEDDASYGRLQTFVEEVAQNTIKVRAACVHPHDHMILVLL